MQNQTVARRYAAAVFSLAKDGGKVTRVGDDLRAAVRAVDGDADARRFFVSPVIDRAVKADVMRTTFEGKLDEIALHTLLLLVRKRREALLEGILREYEAMAQSERGYEPLEIVSARELPASELDELVARLSSVYQKRFELTKRVDPALLGGVRITMGDRRIDGTIAGRLDDLARELLTTK